MADEAAGRSGLEWILDRFPAKAALARRMFLSHPAFRGACEDYRLARQGLVRFETLAAQAPRSEVDEYRVLVHELESELLAMFASADGGGVDPTQGRQRHATEIDRRSGS
jgi:hypothetical protein